MSVAARSTATVIGVWLATPPSTYARRPIVTGGNTPGMAQLASSAGTAGPDAVLELPPLPRARAPPAGRPEGGAGAPRGPGPGRAKPFHRVWWVSPKVGPLFWRLGS